MELITAQELADLLKLSTKTIYRMARLGEIPGVFYPCGEPTAPRSRKLVRFRNDVITRWIKDGQP